MKCENCLRVGMCPKNASLSGLRVSSSKFRRDIQRRRDNKNKTCVFRGGWGQRGKSSQNAVFLEQRHDNNILKVQITLLRNFVVIAQSPRDITEVRGVRDSSAKPEVASKRMVFKIVNLGASKVLIIFHHQPPSPPIVLPEPGSDRKVLTKET